MPWLLDRAPGELRTSALRTLPAALAVYVARYTEACLAATRACYAQARVDLAALSAIELATAQTALEAEGARLLAVQREVALVLEAMGRNRTFAPPRP